MELDFEIEANNYRKCFDLFSKRSDVIIPKIYEEYSTKKVLTMEFIEGIPLHELSAFQKQNMDVKNISHLIMDIFYCMIYEHGFIHADPHPGNLLYMPQFENPTICLLDHGLYRPMKDEFRLSYCKLWLALVGNNPEEIQKCCEELGIVEHWHFFASMLTLKPWKNENETEDKRASKQDIQKYAKIYFKEISATLASMP